MTAKPTTAARLGRDAATRKNADRIFVGPPPQGDPHSPSSGHESIAAEIVERLAAKPRNARPGQSPNEREKHLR